MLSSAVQGRRKKIEWNRFTLATLNVHQWEDAKGYDNVRRVADLVQRHRPGILCLQECSRYGLEQFLPLRPEFKYVARFGGCAVLSKYYMKEYNDGYKKFQKARHVTTEIVMGHEATPIYVTSIHLDHRLEPDRLREESEIHKKLIELFQSGALQVWTGDFNALTREDYNQAGWDHLSMVRHRNHWESPRVELTNKVKKVRGMRDCWAEAGQPGYVGTCRFDTRIDYIYASESFLGQHRLLKVVHVVDSASDHNMVIADFETATAKNIEATIKDKS